jgi:hypothetical protein
LRSPGEIGAIDKVALTGAPGLCDSADGCYGKLHVCAAHHRH